MLVARVLAAAGLVSSMTLVRAPAMATEPALIEHRATAAVIHRIQPTPPVAVPKRETPSPVPAADSTEVSLALELANLRSHVAALQRALEVCLVSMERAIQPDDFPVIA